MKKFFLLAFIVYAFLAASAPAEKMILPWPQCNPCDVR